MSEREKSKTKLHCIWRVIVIILLYSSTRDDWLQTRAAIFICFTLITVSQCNFIVCKAWNIYIYFILFLLSERFIVYDIDLFTTLDNSYVGNIRTWTCNLILYSSRSNTIYLRCKQHPIWDKQTQIDISRKFQHERRRKIIKISLFQLCFNFLYLRRNDCWGVYSLSELNQLTFVPLDGKKCFLFLASESNELGNNLVILWQKKKKQETVYW